jgi:hypothetical protein
LNSPRDLNIEIAKLHRDIFWTRCATGALFFAIAAFLFAVLWHRPKTVEGNQLVLRDDAGKVFAKVEKSKFGDACLTLASKENGSEAYLCVQDLEGAYLDLHNIKSNSRAMLSPGFYMQDVGRTSPALVIDDERNDQSFHINLQSVSNLEMDRNSKKSIVVSSGSKGAKISLFDESGNQYWSTP